MWTGKCEQVGVLPMLTTLHDTFAFSCSMFTKSETTSLSYNEVLDKKTNKNAHTYIFSILANFLNSSWCVWMSCMSINPCHKNLNKTNYRLREIYLGSQLSQGTYELARLPTPILYYFLHLSFISLSIKSYQNFRIIWLKTFSVIRFILARN